MAYPAVCQEEQKRPKRLRLRFALSKGNNSTCAKTTIAFSHTVKIKQKNSTFADAQISCRAIRPHYIITSFAHSLRNRSNSPAGRFGTPDRRKLRVRPSGAERAIRQNKNYIPRRNFYPRCACVVRAGPRRPKHVAFCQHCDE